MLGYVHTTQDEFSTCWKFSVRWFYPFMQRPWKRECLSSLSYLFFLIFNAHLLRFLVNWHPANLVQPLAWDQALQWGGKRWKKLGERRKLSESLTTGRFFFCCFTPVFFLFSPTEEPGPKLCSKLLIGKNDIFFTRKMKAVLSFKCSCNCAADCLR